MRLGREPGKTAPEEQFGNKGNGSDIHAGGKGSRCIHLALSDQLIRALVPKEHLRNV